MFYASYKTSKTCHSFSNFSKRANKANNMNPILIGTNIQVIWVLSPQKDKICHSYGAYTKRLNLCQFSWNLCWILIQNNNILNNYLVQHFVIIIQQENLIKMLDKQIQNCFRIPLFHFYSGRFCFLIYIWTETICWWLSYILFSLFWS